MRITPQLAHVSARLVELAALVPKSLSKQWAAWRRTWPSELAAQGRLVELWEQLSLWERAVQSSPDGPRARRATAELAQVGGTFSKHSAGDLLDWMVELDTQIRQLDADIRDEQTAAPYWGQGDLGAWHNFLYGKENVAPVVPTFGWLMWYHEHSPYWDRWYNTENRWSELIRWDKAFAAWHQNFLSAGGRPSQQTVILGPDDPPAEPVTGEDVAAYAGAALLVAGIFAVGYTVRSFK